MLSNITRFNSFSQLIDINVVLILVAVRVFEIFMMDASGHTEWVNSKAMELAGINKKTLDPVPGAHYYKRDKEGNPTGWLIEAQSFLPVGKKLNIMTPEKAYAGGGNLHPFYRV